MKTLAMIALVLVASVAFAGDSTTQPAKKFAWASDQMNEPVTMTRLELECLKASEVLPRGVAIIRDWQIMKVKFSPSKDLVDVAAALYCGSGEPAQQNAVSPADRMKAALSYIRKAYPNIAGGAVPVKLTVTTRARFTGEISNLGTISPDGTITLAK